MISLYLQDSSSCWASRMVAAPGVPGGAIMASLGILQSMLGFDESAQALMIALYIAMDSFGTACNVDGRRGNRTDYRQSDGKENSFNILPSRGK